MLFSAHWSQDGLNTEPPEHHQPINIFSQPAQFNIDKSAQFTPPALLNVYPVKSLLPLFHRGGENRRKVKG
jgi:hypothetical protein